MNKELFGKRLKTLRKEKNILQSKIAQNLGIRSSTLSGYENGRREPDIETIHKIADYFEVSTDYLLGRTNTIIVSSNNTLEEIDFDLLEKYIFKYNGESLKKEEMEKIMLVIKTMLSMKS